MSMNRRPLIIGGSVAAVVVLAVVAGFLIWGGDDDPEPRARVYKDATACLLTDQAGIRSGPAAAAWAGMQKASVAHSVRVQYQAVSGAQTAENALTYFNGMALQKCAVIAAVGDVPVAAVVAGGNKFPSIQYVLVGGKSSAVPGSSQVRALPAEPSGDVTNEMDRIVSALV